MDQRENAVRCWDEGNGMEWSHKTKEAELRSSDGAVGRRNSVLRALETLTCLRHKTTSCKFISAVWTIRGWI